MIALGVLGKLGLSSGWVILRFFSARWAFEFLLRFKAFVFVGFDAIDPGMGYEVWGRGAISASEVPIQLVSLKRHKPVNCPKKSFLRPMNTLVLRIRFIICSSPKLTVNRYFNRTYHLNRATHAADLTSATRWFGYTFTNPGPSDELACLGGPLSA